jgi:6-phosphogluconolactonase
VTPPELTPEVIIHADAERLAKSVAERLVSGLVAAQSSSGDASVVLTGGRIGIAVLAAVADSPAATNAIDWRRLDVWWGDERFLPSGDPDRNETQAREALLDHVPVDPARVFPMPASDGPDGDDVDAAAERYAQTLAARAKPEDGGPVPRFDILMLGVGPDGHVASLFPGLPGTQEERSVVGVRDSPKPPPIRISMTFPTLAAANEVWLVVAGEDKASAVRLAVEGASKDEIPAAGVRGRQRTLWLVDQAAASQLPHTVERLAAP